MAEPTAQQKQDIAQYKRRLRGGAGEAAPVIVESKGLGASQDYDPAEMERAIGPEPVDLPGKIAYRGKKKAWLEQRQPRPSPTPGALPPKPKMAEGGVVPPVPGGMDITAGEGGEPEVVIPMSKLIRIVGEETAMKIASAAGGGMGPGMGVMGAAASRLRGMGAPPPEEMPEDELEG